MTAPRPRRAAVLAALVILLAVAVVAAATLVWLSRTGHLGGEKGGVNGPTACPANASTLPPTPVARLVPFDLTAGVAPREHVQVIGVWSGVAVFDLYDLREANVWPLGAGEGRDILRGVDVATGAVLWTLDALPDGSGFLVGVTRRRESSLAGDPTSDNPPGLPPRQVAAFCGNLALSLVTSDGTTVVVLALRTGGFVGNHFVPNGDARNEYGQPVPLQQSVSAYSGGVLVVDTWSLDLWGGQPHPGTTTAYRDTDLSSPLWRSEVSDDRGGWYLGPPVLLDRWVHTVSDDYVDLHSGARSGLRPGGDADAYAAGLASVGPVILAIDGLGPWGGYQASERIATWSGANPPARSWTYDPVADDPTLELYPPWTPAKLGLDIAPEATRNALLVSVETGEFDEQANAYKSYLRAVAAADGRVLWSVPLTGSYWLAGTSLYTLRDQQLFLISDYDGTFTLLRAEAGAEYGTLTDAPVSRAEWAGPCGATAICLVAVTGPGKPAATVAAIDYATPTLTPLALAGQPTVEGIGLVDGFQPAYGTPGGLVVIGTDAHGGYQFLTVGA